MSRLSHPLAFATAPLDGTTPDYGGESFFVVGEDNSTGMGDTIVPITRSMAGTMLREPYEPNERGVAERGMQGDRGVVGAAGTGKGVVGGKTLEEYAVENRQLKIAVDQLSKTLASYKEVIPPKVPPHFPSLCRTKCGRRPNHRHLC